jgi:hypothetical protein
LYVFMVKAVSEPPYIIHGTPGSLKLLLIPGSVACCLKYALSAMAAPR